LVDFGLGWWADYILPNINKMILAVEGQTDVIFWNTIFKRFQTSDSSEQPYSD